MKKKAFAILTLCMSLFAAVALVAVAAERKSQPWI